MTRQDGSGGRSLRHPDSGQRRVDAACRSRYTWDGPSQHHDLQEAPQAGGNRGQRPVKGFRPGKEPPQLKKQRAKQRYGDVGVGQERLIELFAERTPAESRSLLRRWRITLLSVAIVLAVAAGFLFVWSVIASVAGGVLALVAFVLWWRLHSQREALEAMADQVGGGR